MFKEKVLVPAFVRFQSCRSLNCQGEVSQVGVVKTHLRGFHHFKWIFTPFDVIKIKVTSQSLKSVGVN